MNWVTALIGAAAGILAGAGGVAKIRPERDKLDADAAYTLQQATTEGIENLRQAAKESVRQAREDAKRAHAEAEEAKQAAASAMAELRQLRAELLQARTEMETLRRSAADERASAAGREAEAQATIRGLSLELQMARLGGGANGAGGFGAA